MVSRRHVLASAVAVGGAAALPSSLDRVRASSVQAYADVDAATLSHPAPAPYAEGTHHLFMHGVASGDPLPTSVILWTRVTPGAEAVPGSGLGPDVYLDWQVAVDEHFTRVVREGRVVATAERDHTVHVDPFGLEPQTTYYYRFLAGGVASEVGRTRTTPADDAEPTQLRMAVASCANLESGYFGAYSDIAERARAGEIDVVVHLGDYLYEYASGVNPGKHGVTRPFEPPWEILSAQDYRVRHAHYRRDTELQAAHAAAPWVVTWDDHEIANDSRADGAEGHGLFEGDWSDRRAAAMGAYLDWMPVRATNPAEGGRLYRSLRFGALAELHMLDLRSYRRAPNLSPTDGQAMMGQEQFLWLDKKLSTSDTTWSLIGTSVMMSPLRLVDLDPVVRGPLAAITGADAGAEWGAGLNPDQWDGYPADRERLLARIAETREDASTVFLTGDIHSEWAAKVSHRDRVIGAELVCSSVSAPNVDDALRLPAGNPVSRAAQRHVLANNPHFEHVDLDSHGYMLVDVDPSGVEARWLRVDDVERAGSPVRVGQTWSFRR